MKPKIKLQPVWSSRRMAVLDGRQVRCMTFDEGYVWVHEIDELPRLVRLVWRKPGSTFAPPV
jgi:hypothetical protein